MQCDSGQSAGGVRKGRTVDAISDLRGGGLFWVDALAT